MNKSPLSINLHDEKLRKILNKIDDHLNIHPQKIDFFLNVNEKKQFINLVNIDNFNSNLRNYKISILGLGKVGLTLLCFLSEKHDIIDGIDINKGHLNSLKKSKINFYEPYVETILKKSILEKKVEFLETYDPTFNNILIICTGPSLNSILDKSQGIERALKHLYSKIRKNDLIILRSTSPVGLSRKIVKNIEKKTDLVCGNDFYFSYSPERAVEGNIINDLKNIPQIVSGYTDNCKEKARTFWLNHCDKVITTDSLEAAEIIKLTNNTYRDFCFSFSNILGDLCTRYNIDTKRLIDAANNGYPRSNLFYPSPGVGGYCLSKDPYLFADALEESNLSSSLIKLRKFNENMALYPYDLIRQFQNKFCLKRKDISILIIGLTFKGYPENDDTRLSSSLKLYEFLIKKEFKVRCYDNMLLKNKNYQNIIDKKIFTNCNKYNVILLMNNNPNNIETINKMLSYINKFSKKRLIFDGWSQLNENIFDKNVIYSTIGKNQIK